MSMETASSERKWKKPLIRALCLVALVFVMAYGGMAVARAALGTETPVMVVPSRSMVPALEVGDIVIIRGIDPHTITVGDVIVFESPDHTIDIIHRVVSIVKIGDVWYFQTKGDNNPTPDPWLTGEQNVRGLLVTNIPYVGYVTLWLQGSPWGLVIICCLILLLITSEYSKETRKTKGK